MKSFSAGVFLGRRALHTVIQTFDNVHAAMDATSIYQSYSVKNSGINQMKRLLLLKFFFLSLSLFFGRKPWPWSIPVAFESIDFCSMFLREREREPDRHSSMPNRHVKWGLMVLPARHCVRHFMLVQRILHAQIGAS